MFLTFRFESSINPIHVLQKRGKTRLLTMQSMSLYLPELGKCSCVLQKSFDDYALATASFETSRKQHIFELLLQLQQRSRTRIFEVKNFTQFFMQSKRNHEGPHFPIESLQKWLLFSKIHCNSGEDPEASVARKYHSFCSATIRS